MPSSTVENYIKQLFLEQQRNPDQLVPMGSLAVAMGVVPGTATSMVKALAESGLVEYEPRAGTRLTKGGEQLALHVLRRHRLLELFLVEVLGLDWSEVHDEAEQLEHVISDRVLDQMDALLRYPSVDPHGDPIPTASGTIQSKRLIRLTECETGSEIKVSRILDQDPRFLQFIDRYGLTPGTTLQLAEMIPEADAVSVLCDQGQKVTLGLSAANKILVDRSK